MRLRTAALALLALLAAFVGCAPTETGNPSLTTSASLVAYSSDPNAIRIGAGNGNSLDGVWLSYAKVDLEPCHGPPALTAVDGPLSEDLLVRPPAAHALHTDLDRFCRILIPLSPASAPLPAGAPAELSDHVLVARGRRGDGRTVIIASQVARQIVLDVGPAGLGLDVEPRRLLIAFDVVPWFANVDLSLASVDTDGVIYIDDARNPSLLAAFEAALDHSASLHRDLDHDGEVDPNELRLDH